MKLRRIKRALVSMGLLGTVVGSAVAVASCTNDVSETFGIYMSDPDNPAWARAKAYFENVITATSEWKYRSQITKVSEDQLKKIDVDLNAGVSPLIVAAVEQNLAGVLLAAKNKDIPVIAYDRLMENANYSTYVGWDNEGIGELQAVEIARDIAKWAGVDQAEIDKMIDLDTSRAAIKTVDAPTTGEYQLAVMVGGSADNNAKDFLRGAIRVLNNLQFKDHPANDSSKRSPKIVFASSTSSVNAFTSNLETDLKGGGKIETDIFGPLAVTNWNYDEGGQKLSSSLGAADFNNFRAVLAPNDGMGIAAVATMLNNSNFKDKVDQIVITGLDANTPGLESIKKNQMKMTLWKPHLASAFLAVAVAKNLFDKNGSENTVEKLQAALHKFIDDAAAASDGSNLKKLDFLSDVKSQMKVVDVSARIISNNPSVSNSLKAFVLRPIVIRKSNVDAVKEINL